MAAMSMRTPSIRPRQSPVEIVPATIKISSRGPLGLLQAIADAGVGMDVLVTDFPAQIRHVRA